MGDEGRLPPPLDGVGAKLNARVPQADPRQRCPRPAVHAHPDAGLRRSERRASGRRVRSHRQAAGGAARQVRRVASRRSSRPAGSWSGRRRSAASSATRSTATRPRASRAIDMTLMTRRLQRDWFHALLLDPQKFRPGTRMPTAVAERPERPAEHPRRRQARSRSRRSGSTCTDGTGAGPAGHGPAVDAARRRSTEAIIYRNFIQGAGPRAIGVGYPEKAEPGVRRQRPAARDDLAGGVHRRGPALDGPRRRVRGARWATTCSRCPRGAAFAVLPKAGRGLADRKRAGGRVTSSWVPLTQGRTADVPLRGRTTSTIEDFPNAVGPGQPDAATDASP